MDVECRSKAKVMPFSRIQPPKKIKPIEGVIMNFLKLNAIILASLGLIVVTGCSNTAQTTETAVSTEHSPDDGHDRDGIKAQIIETQKYHLEFSAVPENEVIHLDFYLQDEANHELISDAKVTAQVQLPNGDPKTIDMEYDAAGEHYAANLEADAEGEYKVVIQADINGEKVNGRFSFER